MRLVKAIDSVACFNSQQKNKLAEIQQTFSISDHSLFPLKIRRLYTKTIVLNNGINPRIQENF